LRGHVVHDHYGDQYVKRCARCGSIVRDVATTLVVVDTPTWN